MYYTIFGRCDTIDDAGYDKTVTQGGRKVEKHFDQWTFNLIVPGQRDYTKVSVAGELAPSAADMERMEDSSAWIYVEADNMRSLVGETDGKPWAITSFTATVVRLANDQERAKLSQDRKAKKVKRAADLKARKDAKKAGAA